MATVPTRSGSPRQLTTKQTGDAWEAQARRWLEGKGLRFIAANVNEHFCRGTLSPLCALWRRGSQCDPQQTTQIITDCPLVARAS